MNIAKTLSILALTVIAGSAIAAPRGPINAKEITSTRTVNYTCQQGRVAVKYNFNGAGCGHEAVPHGDHVDYLVNGRLHHQHGDHCDDHGPVQIVK